MCQKKLKTIKKAGSNTPRREEARLIRTLQHILPPPSNIERNAAAQVIVTEEQAIQNRVILALAWKTMALMYKNKIIQRKIIDLQKETARFVAALMTKPEEEKKFIQNLRQHQSQQQQLPQQTVKVEPVIKMEPNE